LTGSSKLELHFIEQAYLLYLKKNKLYQWA